MSNGVRYTSTFAMPTEYERAAMEARRRQRMAEMLAQQEFRPSDYPTAPIPSAYPLARVLKGFLSGREEALAEKALEKAEAADVSEFENLYKSVRPQERVATEPDPFADPMEMASKYTAPRMETYTPSEEEKRTLLERSAFGGSSPRARRYAENLLAQMDKEQKSDVMEFGDQLISVRGGVATPVTMGGKPLQAAPKPVAGSNISKLIAERDALPVGSPLRAVYDNAIAKETTTAPAVSVNVGDKASNKYTEALAEGVAKQDLEAIALGETAIPQIESSFRVRDLLKQNPITGTGANARLGLEKALATAGFGKGERATITENLSAELAKTTLGAIRSSGLGSGQGFTDKDRQFLERAAAGQIELTQANLLYLAELNDRAGRAAIARSNAVRARARQLPQFRNLPNMFPDIVAPPAYGSQLPPGAEIDQPRR